jgi:N-acetylglucosamine-6-phosphate deacetylase
MCTDLVISNCALSAGAPHLFTLSVSNGRIEKILPSKSSPWKIPGIDAGGRLVSAGLIDVHIQGAGGADILDGNAEAFRAISAACAKSGVTSFLATTVYCPDSDNRHLAEAAAWCDKDLGGGRMIGIHLEGPFISMAKRGMIQPEDIGPCSAAGLERVLQATGDSLKLMTIAPELPGCLDLIRSLRKKGVVCSIAHSAADYDQTLAGIKAGITQATHLFNAMTPIHHRSPGPVPAVLESKDVFAQVIPDGVHLHPSLLRLLWPILGPDRFITITDGIRALGLPDGTYEYNGMRFESKNGAARYRDGTLIGTAVGLNELVRRLSDFTGCSMDDALTTATCTPARSLGIEDKKGSIAVGKDADLAIFNKDLSVWKTIVSGNVVYQI